MGKMDDVSAATRIRPVVVGISIARRSEELAPLLTEMEAKCVLDRMAGFMPQESKAFGVRTAFDF
jgi:hypothetical protein